MVLNRGMRVGRGMGPPYKPMRQNPLPPRIFDLTLLESFFPRVLKVDDEILQKAVLKKIEEILPTAELDSLNALVQEIQDIFAGLISTPGSFTACQIEETRLVGSLKKGTILKHHQTADLVVVLKTLPFVKTIDVLAARILETLKKSQTLPCACVYQSVATDEGFDIYGPAGRVMIRITTIMSNFTKLDPSSHLPQRILENHLAAIKHIHWCEENCQSDAIKNVVRLLRHLKRVHDGFEGLSPWMIDLLANYVVTNTPKREPLSEGLAFKRALQLLSAGLLLNGSSGIPDPCDKNKRLHMSLTHEKQDILCLTAQSLLRILSHGGPNAVLTNKPVSVTSATMWNGVIVNPLDKAYEKPTVEEPAADPDEMEISTEGVEIGA